MYSLCCPNESVCSPKYPIEKLLKIRMAILPRRKMLTPPRTPRDDTPAISIPVKTVAKSLPVVGVSRLSISNRSAQYRHNASR